MYCRNCGKQIEDGAKFCSFCGYSAEVKKEEKVVNSVKSPPGRKVKASSEQKKEGIVRELIKALLTLLLVSVVLSMLVDGKFGSIGGSNDLYTAIQSKKGTEELIASQDLEEENGVFINEKGDAILILNAEGMLSEAYIHGDTLSLNGIETGDIFDTDDAGSKLTDMGLGYLEEGYTEYGEQYVSYISYTVTARTRYVQLYVDADMRIYSMYFKYLTEEEASALINGGTFGEYFSDEDVWQEEETELYVSDGMYTVEYPENSIYGTYEWNDGIGGAVMEIGYYSDTGDDYMRLDGSYGTDASAKGGYFWGFIEKCEDKAGDSDGEKYIAVDEASGEEVDFTYYDSGTIVVTDYRNSYGYAWFDGTYEKR